MWGHLQRYGAVFLLALPTVLAFFSGGYFATARLVAGVLAWIAAATGLALAPNPLPRSGPGRLALAGLALLSLVTGLSILWAPLAAIAQGDFQRLLLYLGALLASVAFLRGRFGLRVVEPALCVGILVVIGYALAGRYFPGFVVEAASRTAAGRLEQPLTYWNAVGALAAVGVVLAVRLAGDRSREARLSACAAAAVVPLGLGVYLSFSRGALLAVVLGVLVVVAVAGDRAQLRVLAAVVPAAVAACLVAGFLPGVRALEGSAGSRAAQGLVMLAVTATAMAASAAFARRLLGGAPGRPLKVPRGIVAAVTVLIVGGALLAVVGTGSGGGEPRYGADTRRLASLESNRYDYWKESAQMLAAHPLLGEGSGAFRVAWRRDYTSLDPALDAHSLPVETAGELGVLGLLALAAFLGGAAWSVVRLGRADRTLAAGAAGALSALALHASMDWDWEMPAVALVGVALLGAVAAALDGPQEP